MSRKATILVCTVPGQTALRNQDLEAASRTETAVRDRFSRNVYLEGGKIVESEPALHIAEFEDPENAIRAAISTRRELARAGEGHSASLIVNEGQIEDRDFSIVGRGLEIALALGDAVPPGQLAVPSRLAASSRPGVTPGNTVAELSGESWTLLDELPQEPPAQAPAESAPSADAVSPPAHRADRRSPRLALLVGGIILLLALVGAAIWLLPGNGESATTRHTGVQSRTVGSATGGPVAIAIVGTTEPSSDAPESIIAGLVELMLRYEAEIVLDSSAPLRLELERIDPAVESDPTPAEQAEDGIPMVRARLAGTIDATGPLSDPSDPLQAAAETVRWLAEELDVRIIEYEQPSEELGAILVSAVVERDERSTRALEEASARESYGPALTFLAEHYRDEGDTSLQVQTLRALADQRPGDPNIWRSIARILRDDGRIAEAVEAWDRVLELTPDDEDALRSIALVALIVGDEEIIETVRARTEQLPIHEADLVDRAGDVATAVRAFYETESAEPENTLTPFRVGRIGVMRRSTSVAELEREKLAEAGVEPEATLLGGYIAADAGRTQDAVRAIDSAAGNADWEDSPHFHFAEIRSLAKDTRGTLVEIGRSVERGEPRIGYIPNNPLFRHLSSEPSFRRALSEIETRQQAIRDSLDRMKGL